MDSIPMLSYRVWKLWCYQTWLKVTELCLDISEWLRQHYTLRRTRLLYLYIVYNDKRREWVRERVREWVFLAHAGSGTYKCASASAWVPACVTQIILDCSSHHHLFPKRVAQGIHIERVAYHVLVWRICVHASPGVGFDTDLAVPLPLRPRRRAVTANTYELSCVPHLAIIESIGVVPERSGICSPRWLTRWSSSVMAVTRQSAAFLHFQYLLLVFVGFLCWYCWIASGHAAAEAGHHSSTAQS